VTRPATGTAAAGGTRLTLISHGMTSALRAARFPDDEDLEPGAVASARSAASRLRAPDRTWCDDTARTRQTVRALGWVPITDPLLADLDVGRWKGLARHEVSPEELHRWCTDPAAAPHGGESVNGLLQRVDGWLQQVTALPGRTVAVTHPAVVRAVLITTLRADASSFWRVDIGPLSATKLRWRAPSWTFQQVNAII